MEPNSITNRLCFRPNIDPNDEEAVHELACAGGGWVIARKADFDAYQAELQRLGWCLDCQGYGQDWSDGSDCQACNGTGKTIVE